MIYLELLKALEDKGIRYVVVGGVAVVLHGFVRATMDIDLIISLDESGLTRGLHSFSISLFVRIKVTDPWWHETDYSSDCSSTLGFGRAVH